MTLKLNHRPDRDRWEIHFSLTDTARLWNKVWKWCWETFGPSCELSEYTILAVNDKPVNERWCWHSPNSYRGGRILIKNEEDRNWFVLRWG